jgi:hypothetical protein
MIKSKKVRWVGRVARNGDVRSKGTVFLGNPGRSDLKELGVYGRIILKLISGK